MLHHSFGSVERWNQFLVKSKSHEAQTAKIKLYNAATKEAHEDTSKAAFPKADPTWQTKPQKANKPCFKCKLRRTSQPFPSHVLLEIPDQPSGSLSGQGTQALVPTKHFPPWLPHTVRLCMCTKQNANYRWVVQTIPCSKYQKWEIVYPFPTRKGNSQPSRLCVCSELQLKKRTDGELSL